MRPVSIHEPASDGIDSLCLRQQDGECIFLKKRGGEHQQYICLVHVWKPAACREWNASLHRKQCQEGLQKYWGLTVAPEGKLQGSEEGIQRFQSFLKSLI
jgi:Fe-S-cluster containining protein